MKTAKRLLALVLTVATLLSCTGCAAIKDGFSQILGMWEELMAGSTTLPTDPGPTEPGDPCEGHYLIDLFDPVDTAHPESDPFMRLDHMMYEDEEIVMAGETFKKGIRFKQGETGRLYLEYDIGGKYKEISFFYGMDEGIKWNGHNVAFQLVDVETGKIIWEDLLERGDIPRFATVNIAGVNLIRLVCYNPDGGEYCFGNITIWEEKSLATDRSYPIVTEPTMLKNNYKFHYSDVGASSKPMKNVVYPQNNFEESSHPLSIKGNYYTHAALLGFNDDLFMNLRGQFKQISFTWGLSDEQSTVSESFRGYLSIYADGVCVLDEFICTIDTPIQTILLDVNYAWQLRFVLRSDSEYRADFVLAELQGGEYLRGSGNSSGEVTGPVPLIQNHYPHFDSSAGMGTKVKIYNSSSRYHFFNMGGEKYTEGMIFSPIFDPLFAYTEPAYAVVDLEGKYKYITFVLGHVDTTAYKPGTFDIYLDGEETPTYHFDISAMDMPKEYTIDVKNCRTIKFWCEGLEEANAPKIGVANLVCYPDEVVDNNIFEPYYKDYPSFCELTDYFTPFGYASYGISKIFYNDGIYADGKYFELYDGSHYKKGLLFCTAMKMNWDHVGFALLWAVGGLSSGQIEEKHSYYIFNVHGLYDTLTFKTGKAIGSNTGEFSMLLGDPPVEGDQVIEIYGDNDVLLYSCNLVDGTIQEHTVDISGVTRLLFRVPSNGTVMSEVYAAFDLFLSQNED